MTSFFGLTDAGKSLVARSRRAALTAALLASALTTAAPALASCTIPDLGAEVGNWWVNPNTSTARGFEVDFTGNVTSVIPAQITADPMTNAYEGLDLWDNQNQVNPTTVTYDSGASLTRVIFSSQGQLPDPVPANWGSYAPDYYGTTYHFGTNKGWQCADPAPLTPVAKYWIYADGTIGQVPFLDASWAGSFAKGSKGSLWAALYIEAKDHSTGGWQLVDYVPSEKGKPVKINLFNGSRAPITIGLAGYELGLTPPQGDCLQSPQCAANQTALEQLNETGMPVPGQPNSPFIPLKVSKKAIPPGGSIVLTLR